MPGLNLPPTPFDGEKSLRRVIDRIILPKFPEVVTYVITPGEIGNIIGYNNSQYKVYYNLYYGITADISVGRARELFEDSYSLFNMLGFDNARLNVSAKRVIEGMSI